jgi:tetratricopeptide (TPR) repeat protein
LRELLAATDAHFHQDARWTEGAIAALAQTCVTCELFEEAVAYYDELIPLHQRTQPDQGIGNGTLSSYYQQLATAHARLGHTPQAVDAASGAIVSWGQREDGRRDALNTLNFVLRESADLDVYVRSLDEKTTKDKQDSPILRKAVGTIYHERGNHAEAARNLQLALELAPGDSDVYALLLQSFDRLERKEDAVDLILSRTSIEPHNLTLYRELATRLADDPVQAERAATSLVEASPLEADNQQALAQLRETQSRWTEAVTHWERASELWTLEPQGLIGLTAAQVHAGDPDAAQQTLNRLKEHKWPSRFDNELANKLPELQNQINAARQ